MWKDLRKGLWASLRERFRKRHRGNPWKKTPEATPRKSRMALRREAQAQKLLGVGKKRFAGSRTISLGNREALVASTFGRDNLDESADNEESFEDTITFGRENLEERTADDEGFDDIVDSYYSMEDESLLASDGSPIKPELPELPTQDPVWRQHGWVSQHCQTTLEVAQSKRVIRRRE
jgi:hypothetical protein